MQVFSPVRPAALMMSSLLPFSFFILILMVAQLLLLNSAHAGVYRCKDSQGRWLFTDQASRCGAASEKMLSRRANVRRNLEFVDRIPDLLQTHPLADFIEGGRNYCAPVAVANSLSWLAGEKRLDQQLHLAGRLAKKRYMNAAANGTTPSSLLTGVERYFQDQNQARPNLQFQGWRSVPQRFRRGGLNKVDVNWLADGISERSTVWLNIGWYQRQPGSNELKRVGGHWVTMVGYELNNPGGEHRLVIHDPAPRSGLDKRSESIKLSRLSRGHLKKPMGGMQRLEGLYQIRSGMKLSERADLAIIDGAVRMSL